MKKYWLIKSEASCYSIDDLKKDKKTSWGGIRNYQARNFLKDMKKGDVALFYHSNAAPSAAVGIANVTKEAYPDPTAFDPKDEHYEPKATKEDPIWMAVEMSFGKKFKREVGLDEIKFNPKLKGIVVAARGSRLSIMPVSEVHFKIIEALGGSEK
jgi:predicted RNA-binding protein with PUA-like domain